MGSYLVRLRVLPTGPEVPPGKLLESLKSSLGANMSIRASKNEPIAFGLYALVVDVVAPEEEGVVDTVEKAIASAPNVSQSELVGVSRLSSRLPPQ